MIQYTDATFETLTTFRDFRLISKEYGIDLDIGISRRFDLYFSQLVRMENLKKRIKDFSYISKNKKLEKIFKKTYTKWIRKQTELLDYILQLNFIFANSIAFFNSNDSHNNTIVKINNLKTERIMWFLKEAIPIYSLNEIHITKVKSLLIFEQENLEQLLEQLIEYCLLIIARQEKLLFFVKTHELTI